MRPESYARWVDPAPLEVERPRLPWWTMLPRKLLLIASPVLVPTSSPNSTPSCGRWGCGVGSPPWIRHPSRSSARRGVGRMRRTCPAGRWRSAPWGGCSPGATGPPPSSPSPSTPTDGSTPRGRRSIRSGTTTGGRRGMRSTSPPCSTGSGRTPAAVSAGTCSTSAPSNPKNGAPRTSTLRSAGPSPARSCGRSPRPRITRCGGPRTMTCSTTGNGYRSGTASHGPSPTRTPANLSRPSMRRVRS